MDAGGRPSNRLLSGEDIGLAKAWAARRPKEAPPPTALHFDFIKASEDWETRQQSEERQRFATEMALHVLAYNLTRVLNIFGVKPIVGAVGA